MNRLYSINSPNGIGFNCKDLLKLEINFTKYQCEKILYLSRKNDNDVIDMNKHTQVLSYFFIKYDMFKNIGNMVKLILINNFLTSSF